MGLFSKAKHFVSRTIANIGSALRKLADVSYATTRVLGGSSGMLKEFANDLGAAIGPSGVAAASAFDRGLNTVNKYAPGVSQKLGMARDLLAP
jgi:hypothetical protein